MPCCRGGLAAGPAFMRAIGRADRDNNAHSVRARGCEQGVGERREGNRGQHALRVDASPRYARKMRMRTLARAPVCRRVHPCAVPMTVDWRAGVSSSRRFTPRRWLSPPLAWIALPCDSPRVETAIFPADI